jgi:hypothetical protein
MPVPGMPCALSPCHRSFIIIQRPVQCKPIAAPVIALCIMHCPGARGEDAPGQADTVCSRGYQKEFSCSQVGSAQQYQFSDNRGMT